MYKMERDWDKKRIVQLGNADPRVIEQWLEEYISTLYTWLYFQVGADADIAADLTVRTFIRAIQELDQFNPDSETMLAWLRRQAAGARDEGLSHWQMKPQHPWAWSQLPKAVLEGLSQLRSEPLSEDVTNNPFVQEMVQAALAEMEAVNRELMMHRYNHLDTPEHIAAEIGISTKDISDRLYRCRHFFRRMLVQLIQSENPGFAETPAAGTLELLDANLEKLLRATNMVQPVSDKHHAKIHEMLFGAAQEAALTRNASSPEKSHAVAILIAAAGLLLLGIVVGFVLFSSKSTPEPVATPSTPTQQEKPVLPIEKPQVDTKEQIGEELDRIILLAKARDLRGLLEILKTGQITSQLTVANFIGKIGDESAIGLLEESEAKWYPNGPADNPFAQAITEIENRLLIQNGAVIEEPNEVKPAKKAETAPDKAPPKQTPPAPQPAVSGTVMDDAAQPIQNAKITLYRNPLYHNDIQPEILTQTVTDAQGKYQFSNGHEGPVFIECIAGPNDSMTIRQAAWCRKDTSCHVSFGGSPIVSGVLNLFTVPASGQLLYLSDTLDPDNASFVAETRSNTQGQFSFAKVAAGHYFLLNKTADNRMVRIGTLAASGQDAGNWQVEETPAALAVRFNRSEQSPAIISVLLTYGPNVSTQLQRFPLLPQENGTWRAENIPTGSYTLVVRLEDGMRLQQDVELEVDQTLTLAVPEGTAALSGQLAASPEPLTLFLHNADQRVRFDLSADADGFYSITSIPPDTYSLSTIVHGFQLDLMVIGLQSNVEQVLDIDPAQWLQNFSPLHVVVTDAKGMLINGAQVWVTGPGEVATAQSTGRGAFLAVQPGDYMLHAALPGLAPAEKQIQVQPAPLTSKPTPKNTILLQLNTAQTP